MPLRNLNAEQLSAVNAPFGHNLIIASAGTGKTSTIVGRIAKLLNDGINPREILLLTFTNKAANEMISRLERHFSPTITKQINAGTFHAVAYRYLKEHVHITLKQPRELKTLLKSIVNVRRFDESVAHYKAEYLYDLMSLYVNTNAPRADNSSLESRNSLRGSHSADSLDLERSQTASLVSRPKSSENYESTTAIPSVVDSAKIAESNEKNVDSTTDSAIRTKNAESNEKNPSLRENERSEFSWQFAELNKETSASPCFASKAKQPSKTNCHIERSEISQNKRVSSLCASHSAQNDKIIAESQNPPSLAEGARGWVDSPQSFSDFITARNDDQSIHSAIYDDIFAEFMEVKKHYHYASYDDLLLLYREQILARGVGFCEVLVDEYQDTNPLQNSIISAYCADSLFCVGDYDQSIYAFNGADIGIIASFSARYKDAQIFSLNKNYRSTRKILNVANKVIANNPRIYPKSLQVVRKSDDSRVEILRFKQTKEQYSFIAKHIADSALHGAKLGDIAVIFRNNTSSDLIEAGLREYGIACRKKGGRSFFESREIALFIDILSLFSNRADMMAFVNIISNGAQIGEVIAKEIYEALSFLGGGDIISGLIHPNITQGANPYKSRARNAQLGLFDEIFVKEDSARFNSAISKNFHSHPILCHPKLNKKSAIFLNNFYQLFEFKSRDLNALFAHIEKSAFWSDLKSQIATTRAKGADSSAIDDFTKAIDKKLSILQNLSQKYDTLTHFLNQIILNSAESSSGDGVHLLTIHASKGLEFESVYIIDLMDGRFPNFKLMAKTGSLEEERRLFYVATTRAKRNLYYCFAYFDSAKNTNYLPSIFLKEAGLI
ncbi:ATP-dependent helicase [Helicobacter sp. 23-1044]